MPGTPADPSARAIALARAEQPVTVVRMVDSRRAEALGRLGVQTVGDLIRHYPFRYLDLATTADLRSVRVGSEATVIGTVHEIKVKRPRSRLTIVEVAIVDGTGALIGVWFNQPYMEQRFRVGERVAFAGTVTFDYGLKQMRGPFVEKLSDDDSAAGIAKILPVHRATEGLSTNWVRRLIAEALAYGGAQPDPLPAAVRAQRDLAPLDAALRDIQFPVGMPDIETARRRLAYDELLAIQLVMAMRRHRATEEVPGFSHSRDGEHLNALRRALQFKLTDDQDAAIHEIVSDMASTSPMNRMLLGDVGTGKTVVAAHALALCADSGTQAAMMAPTEVLAAQYAGAIGPLLDSAGVTWKLLTGSTKARERANVLRGLADGKVSVAFGTHALIQEAVSFDHLTLAIVDEQHRFGVGQRLALRGKGEGLDMLVMTATPIPRSLALTLYGDLDTSYLRVRPGGRGAGHVTTRVVPMSGRADAYTSVRQAVAAGFQAYVVCALVDESDATQAKAANSEARRLQRQVFPDLRVGLLTGQMASSEKTAVMDSFRAGTIDILVATTVIEVGVDVPRATVMLVEDAERFGLAQLHQLRGRVGRGDAPAEFLLFADPRTPQGIARMEAIVSTGDGFELAEYDLRLRGEGEVLGERQSGIPGLRLATLAGDQDLLECARLDAFAMVADDPEMASPEHRPLRDDAYRRVGSVWEWVSAG